MIEKPLVEARITAIAPCCSCWFFAGLALPAVTIRPARRPVAVRTRCIRARFSTIQWLAPVRSRRPASAAEMPRTARGDGDMGEASL